MKAHRPAGLRANAPRPGALLALSAQLVLALVLALAPSLAHAHPSHYGQLARVTIGVEVIAVELDLSPGLAVSDDISRLLDGDGDGVVAADECSAYARRVAAELSLEIDGVALPLEPVKSRCPGVEALSTGEAGLKLWFEARPTATAGSRRVSLQNRHRPVESACSAQAFAGPGVVLSGITRDDARGGISLSATCSLPARPARKLSALPLVAALAGAAGVAAVRRRSSGGAVPRG